MAPLQLEFVPLKRIYNGIFKPWKAWVKGHALQQMRMNDNRKITDRDYFCQCFFLGGMSTSFRQEREAPRREGLEVGTSITKVSPRSVHFAGLLCFALPKSGTLVESIYSQMP
jgi:hypothetical protein